MLHNQDKSMKKLILLITFFIFLPVFVFAEGSGEFLGMLFIALISLGIGIGIFLILRGVVLWYWKVYDIIENQTKLIYEQQRTNYFLEVQNQLLEKLTKKENEA